MSNGESKRRCSRAREVERRRPAESASRSPIARSPVVSTTAGRSANSSSAASSWRVSARSPTRSNTWKCATAAVMNSVAKLLRRCSKIGVGSSCGAVRADNGMRHLRGPRHLRHKGHQVVAHAEKRHITQIVNSLRRIRERPSRESSSRCARSWGAGATTCATTFPVASAIVERLYCRPAVPCAAYHPEGRSPGMARLTAPPFVGSAPIQQPQPIRQRATGLPRLSVVVVNYRQWDKTAELVRQVQASTAARRGDAEVVIADIHSPPHAVVRRLRRQPGVSIRRWGANHGLARAVNEGCRLSQGDWFLLLNPDTTLSEGFLDGVVELADRLADSEPRAGIVGFHLRDADGSQQLSSGPFPTLASSLWRLLLPRRRRKYQTPRATQRCPVPWVTGCCLLVRRECLGELGGVDEAFFLYFEDVDLFPRAR